MIKMQVSIIISYIKIGHIISEKTFMMCPTFLFVILGEMSFIKLTESSINLKRPYVSRITCLPLR